MVGEEVEHPRRRRAIPWLTMAGFLFLTSNSGIAIYRSGGDPLSVLFVVFSYVDLILLFVMLRWYERAPADSSRREWIKIAVWSLTTLLTVAFAYRVAAIMPLPMAVLVWAMTFVTLKGIYHAFLAHPESSTTSAPQNIIGESAV